jgi:hypothetical protein
MLLHHRSTGVIEAIASGQAIAVDSVGSQRRHGQTFIVPLEHAAELGVGGKFDSMRR